MLTLVAGELMFLAISHCSPVFPHTINSTPIIGGSVVHALLGSLPQREGLFSFPFHSIILV